MNWLALGKSREVNVSVASSDSRDARRSQRVARGPTRMSWTWVILVVGVVLGIALVDFLVQNTRSAEIEFFSVSGRVPLTAALLVAALAGASVVLVVGVARMFQLRRGVRATNAARGVVTDSGIPGSRPVEATSDEPSDRGRADA
jgi:uncharacterized integral membrane protein